ncbi:YL1 nuclear protein-domain-containing protein [Biscogniauxia sp. FL1348]|nr:YL1 nuclear protein-domain-containing protein [Biscogniauxia sp. FL1348]
MAATGADEDEDQRMQLDENEADAAGTDSSSDDSDSGDDGVAAPVEWLATGREKRSTAGNRMKSMIAAEEPDDELELLFAEDGSDEGFTDVDDDASDVRMDSSSDEEDTQENADELEGEKELERQARESRQAARKRKAQEAIPIKFRKKVKIDTSRTGSSTPTAPKPRPKKKSERTSWLPSPADMPTRASKRETTMLGKEQLHKQMIEREVKRLKQVEAMERKAKKMEALKKPPMTQAQRLAEAALVEKKNAKSLNRWEEAEKQREEERKAKLAALNNRTLEGPVVTFWSGMGEWVDGKLKHVGKIVTIEEKPAKKKRNSDVGNDGATADTPAKEKAGGSDPAQDPPKEKAARGETAPPTAKEAEEKAGNPTENEVKNAVPTKEREIEKPASSNEILKESPQPAQIIPPEKSPAPPVSIAQKTESSPPIQNPSSVSSQTHVAHPLVSTIQAQEPKLAEARPQAMKAPDMIPPSTSPYTTSMFAPPHPSPLMKPPELKPPSSSFLAPPAGATQSGLSMPMLEYHSTPATNNPSNVLAPPNTAQRQSPLSMPQPQSLPPPAPMPPRSAQPTHAPIPTPSQLQPQLPSQPPPQPLPQVAPQATPQAVPKSSPASQVPQAPAQAPAQAPPKTPKTGTRPSQKTPLGTLKPGRSNAQKQPKEVAPPPPPPPPANGKATRNCIILQNFNENAVKEKAVQNQILFGKDMSKLGKQAPPPRCVITNHPARYRDPKTGLPYYNAYAYREIQKLQQGNYKWSRLVGAWTGSGSYAASGVPARFLDPDAPGPAKPAEPEESPKQDAPEPGKVECTEKHDTPESSSIATPSGTTGEPNMQLVNTTAAAPPPPSPTSSTKPAGPVGESSGPPVVPTDVSTQTRIHTDVPSIPSIPVAPSVPADNTPPAHPPAAVAPADTPALVVPMVGGETIKQ